MKEIKDAIEVSGCMPYKHTNTKNVTGFITNCADFKIYTNCTIIIPEGWHGYLMHL